MYKLLISLILLSIISCQENLEVKDESTKAAAEEIVTSNHGLVSNVTAISNGELLIDAKFKNGFNLLKINGDKSSLKLQFNSSQPPVWEISQWHARLDLENTQKTKLNTGAFAWADAEKSVIIGPAGTMESDLNFRINTDYSFGGVYRKATDPKDWPHLYTKQDLRNHTNLTINQMDSLNINLDVKLDYVNHIKTAGYNSSLHTGQFVMFITVQNLKGNKSTNANYGKYFWFGVPIYDARFVNIGQKTGHVDKATQSYIYSMDYNLLSKTSVHSGEWVNLNANILPSIKAGINYLKTNGMEIGEMSDFKLGSIVFGWECPGLFIGSMLLKNFSLKVASSVSPAPPTSSPPSSAPPKETYSWKTSSFGLCTKECGSGTQTRSVQCVNSKLVVVADSFCSYPKPILSRSCNTQTCDIPIANENSPFGYVDKFENGNLKGWAYDADSPNEAIKIHVYKVDVNGVKTFYKGILTSTLRNDVNTSKDITGNHGFNLSIPIEDRPVGTKFHVYGIDAQGLPNKELNKSPYSF